MVSRCVEINGRHDFGESDRTCSTLGSTLQSVLNQTGTPGIHHDRDFRVVLGPFCTQRMKLLQCV